MKHLCWILGLALLGFSTITCAPQGGTGNNGKTGNILSINGEKDRPPITVPGSLKGRINAALDHTRRRDLMTSHSFWTIFHALLGMGFDTTLLDEKTSERVRAIDFIRTGGNVNGMKFLQAGDGLDVETLAGSGTGQGHQDQFVSEMAQWGLPPETEFLVNGLKFKFADFHRFSKARASVKSDQELSWAIIIISQYFGTDITWTNNQGEKLSFEDVVKYEIDQPVDGAACGGTHRLFGITWALHLHLKSGGKKTGVWKSAADHLAKYIAIAKSTQNLDGTFSTNYLSGPGNTPEPGVQLATTGHVFEWLALALTDEELGAPWMQNAASKLSLMILETRSDPVEGGALYHAAHGLQMYRDRVFGVPQTPNYRGPLIPLPPKE